MKKSDIYEITVKILGVRLNNISLNLLEPDSNIFI